MQRESEMLLEARNNYLWLVFEPILKTVIPEDSLSSWNLVLGVEWKIIFSFPTS
jgi:hypothetical protein